MQPQRNDREDGEVDRRRAAANRFRGAIVARLGLTRWRVVFGAIVVLVALAGGMQLFASLPDDSASGARAAQTGPMPGMNMATAQATSSASSLPPTPLSSPTQMNGLIMPPGAIITPGMSMQAMEDMSAVDLSKVTYTAPADARGDQPLAPEMVDGVKVFNLDASLIKWNILPGVQVAAYAFNQQVPGPRIRLTEGDRVRFIVKNDLPEPTSVHWHGLVLPNQMDGVSDVTQQPIAPGGSYTYEFTVQQAGTFFYHSHTDPDRQQALGMYGALIIDPKDPAVTPAYDKELTVQLQEWTVKEGYTFPSMPMEGLMPNFFTINGKAYPATETVKMRVAERLLVRFIGSSNSFIHPMHIHGGPFRIVATDGNPVPAAAQVDKDTVNVAPGERYDVVWTARQPGKWLLHCHINHHITNDGVEEQGGGGLTMVIDVAP
jgi:manganese oxidase